MHGFYLGTSISCSFQLWELRRPFASSFLFYLLHGLIRFGIALLIVIEVIDCVSSDDECSAARCIATPSTTTSAICPLEAISPRLHSRLHPLSGMASALCGAFSSFLVFSPATPLPPHCDLVPTLPRPRWTSRWPPSRPGCDLTPWWPR